MSAIRRLAELDEEIGRWAERFDRADLPGERRAAADRLADLQRERQKLAESERT